MSLPSCYIINEGLYYLIGNITNASGNNFMIQMLGNSRWNLKFCPNGHIESITQNLCLSQRTHANMRRHNDVIGNYPYSVSWGWRQARRQVPTRASFVGIHTSTPYLFLLSTPSASLRRRDHISRESSPCLELTHIRKKRENKGQWQGEGEGRTARASGNDYTRRLCMHAPPTWVATPIYCMHLWSKRYQH